MKTVTVVREALQNTEFRLFSKEGIEKARPNKEAMKQMKRVESSEVLMRSYMDKLENKSQRNI
jgi:hypothetical protein